MHPRLACLAISITHPPLIELLSCEVLFHISATHLHSKATGCGCGGGGGRTILRTYARMINMASSTSSFLILFVAAALVADTAVAGDSDIASKCSKSFGQVYSCVNYANGKDDSPSSGCCSEVTKIRNDNPVCLCYIYQQTHDGTSSTVKSLGLQFDRLIRLPGACNIANSSASDCPKLLNLSPSSPDYNIFTENATAVAASSPAATTGASSSSDRTIHSIRMDYAIAVAMLSAIFLNIFQGAA